MSSFCTKCVDELGFDEIDIMVGTIFESCEPGNWVHPFLCEGCGLFGIGKDLKGQLEIYYYEDCMDFKNGKKDTLTPVVFKSIEEWMNSKNI
jgi:hypothetical protein